MTRDSPRRQCPKCPWKVGTDPHQIPRGYCVEKHKALTRTMAEPGRVPTSGELRIMSCHDSPLDAPIPCVGWLDNQLGPGNNIGLRLAAMNGHVDTEYEVVGPQHYTLEATFPQHDEPHPNEASETP